MLRHIRGRENGVHLPFPHSPGHQTIVGGPEKRERKKWCPGVFLNLPPPNFTYKIQYITKVAT